MLTVSPGEAYDFAGMCWALNTINITHIYFLENPKTSLSLRYLSGSSDTPLKAFPRTVFSEFLIKMQMRAWLKPVF